MVGAFSLITSLIAACMYLFMYAGHPFTVESLFCVAPMGCLLAFAVYRKFVLAGASTQTILYVVALWGAERVIQADCALGNCTSQNKIIIALSAMLAGFQMMGMLAVTIMMWLGTWKKLRPEESL